jgi:rhamnose utilization protein RhaD (predicted bifunctional aldolase and dehydrogenase)
MNNFVKISQCVGRNIVSVQGPAGNTSLKEDDHMIIKASGALLKNVSDHSGYVTCDLAPIRKFFSDSSYENSDDPEAILNRIIDQSTHVASGKGVASIETGMHALLPSDFVLHTHSVYLNVATCMEEGESVLREALDVPFVYIPYVNPGFFLSLEIGKVVAQWGQDLPSVLLLENHGLTVHGDNPDRTLELTQKLTDRMADFLFAKNAFEPFRVLEVPITPEHHLFPDSAVFSGIDPTVLSPDKRRAYFETASAAAYIQNAIERLGATPRFLKKDDTQYIQNMKKEKQRRQPFQQTL